VRLVERDDLGDSPSRLDVMVPRELRERLEAAVPRAGRGKVVRRALWAELQRISKGTL
jgi:hypothetical protein